MAKLNKHGLPILGADIKPVKDLTKAQNVSIDRRERREIVYSKTNGHCYYCGRRIYLNNFTIDHYLPRHGGGTSLLSNLVPACQNCNHDKGHKLPSEYKVILLRRSEKQGIVFYGETLPNNKRYCTHPDDLKHCVWCDYRQK